MLESAMIICLATHFGASAAAPGRDAAAERALLEEFRNPGPKWRGKPFWSWNGKLRKDELIRQIHVIQEMGFGGFFMHSRTGLATEYLGDEWFELINACADEGERLGLEAWLYDEDRWPSGSAGGLATEDPRYRMKYLRLRIVPGREFRWDDGLVAAFACTLDGIDYSDAVRIKRDTPPDGYSGRTVLAFSTETMEPHPFYNGNTYLDTLNREATERFISITHDRYKARCGDRLGTSIPGIFTDEPHHGMVMCRNVSHNSGSDPAMVVPWTPKLFPLFEERFGYDLVSRLPELFLRPDGRRISKVKWNFMEHLQQMFLENWARPVHQWCRRNGLELTGHVLHEDTLGSQAVPCGSVMRYYEHMDRPGVDVLTEGNRNYWIVKQLDSAARQLGKRWLLSELYGCTGWQMDFEAHKAVGAWQALFGINVRCHHLSWYTMGGEAKRDYPASFLHQSSWYKDYEPVETWFSRLHVFLAQGEPCCDILVLNPIESAWCQIHAGWATWLAATAPEVVALDGKYQSLFHWLCGAHLDFDYGEEDFLARMARIEAAPEGPLFHVGKAAYRVVVMAGMETARSTTLEKLEEFLRAGGCVVVAGDPPGHVDALPSSRAADLAGKAVRTSFTREAIVGACLARARRPVEILAGEAGATEIFCRSRRAGDRLFAAALNVNREEWLRGARILIEGSGAVEEWDLMTGERRRVRARARGGRLEFEADFPPSGLHAYTVVPRGEPSLPLEAVFEEIARTAVEGPFEYALDEPNLCVLDRAASRLNDEAWDEPREILKVDRAVRQRLGLPLRGGEMLQPWFVEKRVLEEKGRLSLRFDFHVETVPAEPVFLLAERPELFSVSVNGTVLSAVEAQGWFIDPCLKRLPVPPSALREGENSVELACALTEAVNLEALYLLGRFGVRVEGTKRTLTALPEKLEAGSVTSQGLPFYSGRIRYALTIEVRPEPGERLVLCAGEFEGACAAVRAGDASKFMPWTPYEADITDVAGAGTPVELEIVLTRRNTFGPLHQVPLRAPAYGPGNWVTEGPAFTDRYMLYPAGLLANPELVRRREMAAR